VEEKILRELEDGEKTFSELVAAGLRKASLSEKLPKLRQQNLIHRYLDPYSGRPSYRRNKNAVIPISILEVPLDGSELHNGPYRLTKTRVGRIKTPEWVQLTVKGRETVDNARRLLKRVGKDKRPVDVDVVVERLLWAGLRTIHNDV
jgi:DNA-binding transcriptional ArsR family regulator